LTFDPKNNHRSNTLSVDAIRILLLLLLPPKEYVLCAATTYAKRLRVVDLTALRDTEHQACPCRATLGRWARTTMLTRICYETLEAMQRDDGDEGAAAPCAFQTAVDVRFHGFVTGRNYDMVVPALLLLSHCPLKLRFVGFRADSLALKQLFYVLRLAQPEAMSRLEVVHNVPLEAPHLEVLLSRVEFPRLRSLTLPAGALDVRRLGSEDANLLATIGELLSRLLALTELYLGFSTLTGQLRRLLR